MGNIGREIIKWLYVFTVAAVMFLFFCLFLDVFSYVFLGGWRPLIGKWPIFSGTVSSIIYGPPFLVAFLLIGLAGIGRITLGNDVPGILLSVVPESPSEDNGEEES